ncbi:hypothetical protein J6590_064146 [Homalodisca vitripennis]|nr:hypothetical protein J6590_064146 [Homalodisca vitripennis]
MTATARARVGEGGEKPRGSEVPTGTTGRAVKSSASRSSSGTHKTTGPRWGNVTEGRGQRPGQTQPTSLEYSISIIIKLFTADPGQLAACRSDCLLLNVHISRLRLTTLISGAQHSLPDIEQPLGHNWGTKAWTWDDRRRLSHVQERESDVRLQATDGDRNKGSARGTYCVT